MSPWAGAREGGRTGARAPRGWGLGGGGGWGRARGGHRHRAGVGLDDGIVERRADERGVAVESHRRAELGAGGGLRGRRQLLLLGPSGARPYEDVGGPDVDHGRAAVLARSAD